jgi:hypothetical protein
VVDSPTTFLIIFLSLSLAFISYNKIVFGKIINGMIGTEFSLLFVASIVIHLYVLNLATKERLTQYLVVEGIVFIALSFFYKSIIKKR